MGEPEDLDVGGSLCLVFSTSNFFFFFFFFQTQGAIVFLASDASRFMTGSEIRIDGGYCCI